MTTFKTTRKIPAAVEQVFAAFQPERLARWWGPAGFTNTFSVCDVKPGGRWSFVMHGPEGASYPNESVFAEVDPPSRLVIDHVSEPQFRLTVTVASDAKGAEVFWAQEFASADLARRIEHIVVPANEQNLDRLSAEVLRQ
jgi:uncharacterized protein YndB with AHSA1/START domain